MCPCHYGISTGTLGSERESYCLTCCSFVYSPPKIKRLNGRISVSYVYRWFNVFKSLSHVYLMQRDPSNFPGRGVFLRLMNRDAFFLIVLWWLLLCNNRIQCADIGELSYLIQSAKLIDKKNRSSRKVSTVDTDAQTYRSKRADRINFNVLSLRFIVFSDPLAVIVWIVLTSLPDCSLLFSIDYHIFATDVTSTQFRFILHGLDLLESWTS